MSKSWVCLSSPVFCAQRVCGTRWGGRWSCHWGRESNWRSKETRRRTEFWWVDACCRQPASSSGHHGLAVSLNVLSSDFRPKDGTSVKPPVSPFIRRISLKLVWAHLRIVGLLQCSTFFPKTSCQSSPVKFSRECFRSAPRWLLLLFYWSNCARTLLNTGRVISVHVLSLTVIMFWSFGR